MRSTAAMGSHRWGYYFSDRHKENLKASSAAKRMLGIIKSGKRGL